MDYETLRRSVRALAGIDRDILGLVAPVAMRRVCLDRGWSLDYTRPFPGEPDRVAFEVYDHPTAMGQNHYGVPSVMVPVDPTAGDYVARVVDWVEAMASRHGDVAPAEVLAEAFEAGRL